MKHTKITLTGILLVFLACVDLHGQNIIKEYISRAHPFPGFTVGKWKPLTTRLFTKEIPITTVGILPTGSVVFNGILYEGLNIRLDIYKQQAVVRTPTNNVIVIPCEKVRRVSLHGRTFDWIDTHYAFASFLTQNDPSAPITTTQANDDPDFYDVNRKTAASEHRIYVIGSAQDKKDKAILKGRILVFKAGEPIPGVMIRLQNSKAVAGANNDGNFSIELPVERVYVYLDKEYYLAGETAWVKFLALDHQNAPSALSKAGYV